MLAEKLSNKYQITMPEGTIVEGNTFNQLVSRLGPFAHKIVAFENPVFKNDETGKEYDFLTLLQSEAALTDFETKDGAVEED
jgi:hypothetical protein